MRLITSLMFAVALVAPSIAGAADRAAPFPSEIRLSDEEKEKVLEAAANRREAPKGRVEGPGEVDGPPQIHGEVGFAIGAGGYHSMFGTAVVPLKDDGLAVISLDSTDFGSGGRVVRPWHR